MNSISTQQRAFLHTCPGPGTLFDFSTGSHPALVSGWCDSEIDVPDGSTHFGFVSRGHVRLRCASGAFDLNHGMYFAVPGAMRVAGHGTGMVVSMTGVRALFQIGGPVEAKGRLRYIDGCSDTLLIAPPLRGDPCLNLLHIPPGTNQTAHTHPSLRVGIVVDGAGSCRTPEGDTPLTPGLVFAIPTGRRHSFHTDRRSLRIVAWHPDSDCGPTDDDHPMLNRTVVDARPVNAPGD